MLVLTSSSVGLFVIGGLFLCGRAKPVFIDYV